MGGLFSSKGVSLRGFRLDDRKDPEHGGEGCWLPVLSRSSDPSGDKDALPSLPAATARFSRIEGGADSGDDPSCEGRDFDKKPAWNRLDFVVGMLEVSAKVNEGLESDKVESMVLRR